MKKYERGSHIESVDALMCQAKFYYDFSEYGMERGIELVGPDFMRRVADWPLRRVKKELEDGHFYFAERIAPDEAPAGYVALRGHGKKPIFVPVEDIEEVRMEVDMDGTVTVHNVRLKTGASKPELMGGLKNDV